MIATNIHAMTAADRTTGAVGWVKLRRRVQGWEFTPFRITILYLIFGFLALYVSDVLFVRSLDEPLLSRVQALKGGVEVLLTGGLIYILTRRSRAQLRGTNETLERQREELDVLHRALRHNLRNALTVIAGRARTLGQERNLTAEKREHCERIEATARQIVELVEQASRVRRVTADVRPVVVDLTETVQSVVHDHPRIPADVDLRTDLPESAPALVNHLFEDALAELIENALVHADTGARTRIDVGIDRDPAGGVVLTVADDGPGVGDTVPAIFEHGELDQLRHLDGMGLWFVYWTVTDSDGEFTIEDNEWGGTTVRLRLPEPGDDASDEPAQPRSRPADQRGTGGRARANHNA